ncbi:hypothetical protein [Streptomyces sp. A012304]|uniref:hypothetical protein n=1 Tax=Streptomyces sp. A012304 TaxID=375446 RepID=UPI0022314613|nr:hypothetical protein [Streptomyces sp. A012304]GKQ35497.1 hypothetical protein ALMP_20400 [Streptomyces sp. A012304]
MTRRFACAALAAAGLISLFTGTATAAPAGGPQSPQSCEGVRLTGSLPVPPAGLSARQTVTIDEDCTPRLGKVRYVPINAPAAAAPEGVAAADATSRKVRSWNEMFDCCNIRMTGLYTTADWNVADGRITTASTAATQGWNREPWDAGWSLKSSGNTQDCATACSSVTAKADASFTYKGIFDTSGDRYANTHHTSVRLAADGTATCTFDVELKNTFIGWNWQRGCE